MGALPPLHNIMKKLSIINLNVRGMSSFAKRLSLRFALRSYDILLLQKTHGLNVHHNGVEICQEKALVHGIRIMREVVQFSQMIR